MKPSLPVRRTILILIALNYFLPSVALAHIGTETTHGFMAGMLHPLSGLDHLCAMVAVGIWATQLGQRAIWIVPLTFVSIMTMGSALGFTGIALPYGAQGIVISLLLLGTLIAASAKLPLTASTIIVAAFALCHGHAHGTEMPDTASGLTYGIGFVMTTILIHGVGIMVGLLLQRESRQQFVRYTGAMIALFGGYLWLV